MYLLSPDFLLFLAYPKTVSISSHDPCKAWDTALSLAHARLKRNSWAPKARGPSSKLRLGAFKCLPVHSLSLQTCGDLVKNLPALPCVHPVLPLKRPAWRVKSSAPANNVAFTARSFQTGSFHKGWWRKLCCSRTSLLIRRNVRQGIIMVCHLHNFKNLTARQASFV